MITLDARERGLFTAGPAWAGTIVSVYTRAVNIRRPDGLLVSLVRCRGQMSALSVLVPELFDSAPDLPPGIERGRRASYNGQRLIVAGRAVTLDRAPWYDSTLRLACRPGFPAPKRALLQRALLTRGKKGGLLGVIAPAAADNPFARTAAGILGAVTLSGGPREKLVGLGSLVGLGIGFTPSGDDFLAGALLAEASRWGALCLARAEIRAALAKTSDGGRSLLYQVLENHFPCYLLETAQELAAARNAGEIGTAVARAVRHGETSGTDTLTGLLWYLRKADRDSAQTA